MTDLDWISFRAAQSYPLADQATGLSLTGNTLPQSFLLDIQLLVPAKYSDNLAGQFYISSLQDLGSTYSIVIAYSGIDCALCTGISKSLQATSTISSRTYLITPIKQEQSTLQQYPWMNALTGNLCAGITQDYSGGSLTFDIAGAQLHAMCVHFTSGQSVQALVVDNKYLTGVVTIEAEEGIQVAVREGSKIVFSLDRTYLENLWNENIAQYQAANAGRSIKTINGVAPDSNGNISISPVDCIQINPINNGITISNPCAKPCCDSQPALQGLNTSIKILQQQHKTFRDYWINMSNVVNYMQANLSTLMSQRS